MKKPLLLLHDPDFGGMGSAARFLRASLDNTASKYDVLSLSAPRRAETSLGRPTATNLLHGISLIGRIIRKIAGGNVSQVYLPIAQWGLPFVRDLLIVGLCRVLGTPLVIHLHGSELVEVVSNRRLARLSLNTGRWLVLSDRIRDLLSAQLNRAHVVTLRNPAPAEAAYRRTRIGSETVHFGFLGAVSQGKGTDIAVDAFQRLLDRSSTDLTVAGPLAGHHLESGSWGTYVGRLSGESLEAFWRSIDVLLLPSRWHEGLPFVVLEALQQGVCVLVSESDGLAELIECGAVDLVRPTADDVARCVRATAADLEGVRIRQQAGWAVVRDRYSAERLASEWRHAVVGQTTTNQRRR